jgi:hypothetical protein
MSADEPEQAFKQQLIFAINKAYCPVPFSVMETRLYLWIGHRYHEQPAHGYVANQSISDAELQLLKPRLPKRLEGAFEYQPDHLILQYSPPNRVPIRLKIDYALYTALERLSNGLPRELLPDRELNRLDYFIEELRRSDVSRTREFHIHSNAERITTQIRLSVDRKQYESVSWQ